jgi:hypothetical protein
MDLPACQMRVSRSLSKRDFEQTIASRSFHPDREPWAFAQTPNGTRDGLVIVTHWLRTALGLEETPGEMAVDLSLVAPSWWRHSRPSSPTSRFGAGCACQRHTLTIPRARANELE